MRPASAFAEKDVGCRVNLGSQTEKLRLGTGRNNHGVRFRSFDGICVQLRIQMDGNVKFFQLVLIPCNERMVVLFEIGSAAGNQISAEASGFFVDLRLMTADCQNTCGFTTRDAAADNQDLLFVKRRHQPLGAFPAGLRIHRAVQRGILLNAPHAAFMAG